MTHHLITGTGTILTNENSWDISKFVGWVKQTVVLVGLWSLVESATRHFTLFTVGPVFEAPPGVCETSTHPTSIVPAFPCLSLTARFPEPLTLRLPWTGSVNLTLKIFLFTLVLTRVSGLTMTSPTMARRDSRAFARPFWPSPWHAGLRQRWHLHLADPGTTLMYLVMVGGELVIGGCLGTGITILLSGIQMTGDLIGRAGGLTVSDLFDPTFNSEVPLFSRLLFLVATAVFVCMGGHRVVMAGMLDTFAAMPPGSVAGLLDTQTAAAAGHASLLQSLSETFVTLLAESFQLGVRACVPVVLAALLATLVIGLIGRTLPQLNVMAIGFSFNANVDLRRLVDGAGGGHWVFQERWSPCLESMMLTS